MEYTGCNHEVLGDGYLLCDNVLLTRGEVCTAYFGPCGIYVIADRVNSSGAELYSHLREILGIVHVRLYVQGYGVYDSQSDKFTALYLTDDELNADVNAWLSDRRPLYKEDVLWQLMERLEGEDAKARGYKISEDGSMYLYRHGKLYPASPHNSNTNYLLALFGGTLGIHRFAQGKWFTGLAYLLTGGMVLVGWFVDVLALLLGVQRDKRKRLFFPLSHRFRKLLLFPLGLFVSVAIVAAYFIILKTMFNAIQAGLVQQVQTANTALLQSVLDALTGLQNP